MVDTELPFEGDFEDWEPEDEEPAHPGWRRPALMAVASVTALALALVPLYNVFGGGPRLGTNGLEVCGFDYCVVQDRVREAGLDLVMSRLANTFLSDEEAARLAAELTDHLDVDPVNFGVVDELAGRLGGVYDPVSRSILIERPARAWIVLHEMAHVAAPGHGDEFMGMLIDLAAWAEDRLVR